MIVVGVSSADAMAKIDDVESRFTANGRPVRVALFGMLGAIDRLFLIGAETQRTMLTLELSVPAFEVPMRFPESRPRSNPHAPIPERVRRQLGRDPDKKPWHRR